MSMRTMSNKIEEGTIDSRETLKEEIIQFLTDIRSWVDASKEIVGDRNINFNPELFLLWKLWRSK